MVTNLSMDGEIIRDGDHVIVRVAGETYAANEPGVTCLNPGAPEAERVYEKIFRQKEIYLPEEYDQAVGAYLSGENIVVLSMNGYSRLSPKHLLQYGIKEGEYEAACAAVLRYILRHIPEHLKAEIRLVYGASDLGVDKAQELVAREFSFVPLGFSCPRYMLYVKDDDLPVYVSPNSETYADAYIRSLDFLIAAGGRAQAFKHDVVAACIYQKRIHFLDILSCLSRTGGVPATVTAPDGSVTIENAPAAFGRFVTSFGRDDAIVKAPPGGDRWDAIFSDTLSRVVDTCRTKLPPKDMFA